MIRATAITKIKLLSRSVARRFSTEKPAQVVSISQSHYLTAIANELRNPIDTIASYSEILVVSSQNSEIADSKRDYHDAILESSRQLQRILGELSEAADSNQNTAGFEQLIDVAEMLQSVAETLRNQAELKNLIIILRVIDEVEVRGELRRLRKVLLRLLSDAVAAVAVMDTISLEMRSTGDGGLEIAILSSVPWLPQTSFVKQIIASHGGKLLLKDLETAEFEVRLLLPAQRINWPSGRQT